MHFELYFIIKKKSHLRIKNLFTRVDMTLNARNGCVSVPLQAVMVHCLNEFSFENTQNCSYIQLVYSLWVILFVLNVILILK